MALNDDDKERFLRRITEFERILHTLPEVMRRPAKNFFQADLDEAKIAISLATSAFDSTTQYYYGPAGARFFVLCWTDYKHTLMQFDLKPPNTFVEHLEDVRVLIEKHMCRNAPIHHEYKSLAYDLDAEKLLRWIRVDEVRWVNQGTPHAQSHDSSSAG